MIKPPLDPGFVPAVLWMRDYLCDAHEPFSIAVEREDGQIYRFDTHLRTDGGADTQYFAQRLVKTLLWIAGGWRIHLSGNQSVCECIAAAYREGGARAFDTAFLSSAYGRPFAVQSCPGGVPPASTSVRKAGSHTDGCRIGLDAGGTAIKICAMQDGHVVWSGVHPWEPKAHADLAYHRAQLSAACTMAANELPRVDALGVSTAGIVVGNRVTKSSLFVQVPGGQGGDIYAGLAPRVTLVNDGDAAALAGALELGRARVLGVSMGTSQAGGYVDAAGCVTGQINELAFVPVDYRPDAPVDPWSGDAGCGVSYLSQDAVARLAPRAGIALSDNLTPSQKLHEVQALLDKGYDAAADIFRTIGVYLGYAAAQYALYYDIGTIRLLGGVTVGRGGELIAEEARRVLAAEFPELDIIFSLPESQERRLGQAFAAATL